MKALFKITLNESYREIAEIMGDPFEKMIWRVGNVSDIDEWNENMFVEDVKMFTDHQIALEELPSEIQDQVKGTLKYFDRSHVYFQYGEFHESAGCFISASYPQDFFSVGAYRSQDVYTKEEKREFCKELDKMVIY